MALSACAKHPQTATVNITPSLLVLNNLEELDADFDKEEILRLVHAALGTPYIYGGRNPEGFDCSGLVQWAYSQEGVTLPRTARDQSQIGKAIFDIEEMRPGDIVAFRHPRRGYHTGIYIGEGKFIHSPRKKSHVKISSLNEKYFREIFLGARRINSDNLIEKSGIFVAQADPNAITKPLNATSSTSTKTSNKKISSKKKNNNKKNQQIKEIVDTAPKSTPEKANTASKSSQAILSQTQTIAPLSFRKTEAKIKSKNKLLLNISSEIDLSTKAKKQGI